MYFIVTSTITAIKIETSFRRPTATPHLISVTQPLHKYTRHARGHVTVGCACGSASKRYRTVQQSSHIRYALRALGLAQPRFVIFDNATIDMCRSVTVSIVCVAPGETFSLGFAAYLKSMFNSIRVKCVYTHHHYRVRRE